MKKMCKKKALEALKEHMKNMGGEELKDKMAVKVVSDSPEGLEEGLEKAKEVLEDKEGLKKLFKDKYKYNKSK